MKAVRAGFRGGRGPGRQRRSRRGSVPVPPVRPHAAHGGRRTGRPPAPAERHSPALPRHSRRWRRGCRIPKSAPAVGAPSRSPARSHSSRSAVGPVDSTTSTSGWVRWNAVSTGGRRTAAVVSIVPIRRVPRGAPRPVSSSTASSCRRQIASAWPSSRRPAGVSHRSPDRRSKSRTPSSASSFLTWAVTLDWTVFSRLAAATKLPSRATARNRRRDLNCKGRLSGRCWHNLYRMMRCPPQKPIAPL